MGHILSLFSSKHGLKYAQLSRTPPDPDLFPRYIQNKQGLWLRFAEWSPPREVPTVRALLFIISGLGEHTGRYDGLAVKFAREGYYVFCMDNQGAGGSEGVRLYAENFNHFVDDFLQFKQHVLSLYPKYATLPHFLLGHSMGGLVALHVSLREPKSWAAVVLSAPALLLHSAISTSFMQSLARLLSSCVPKLRLRRVKRRWLSMHRPVVELARQDPFFLPLPVPARLAAEMLRAAGEVWANVEKSTFPLLIVHGAKDKVCSIDGSRRWMNVAVSLDKKMMEYPEMYHEVLTEVGWKEVQNDILLFLNAHCLS